MANKKTKGAKATPAAHTNVPQDPTQPELVKTNEDGSQVAIPPIPVNPHATEIATGTVPGISGAPTEPGTTQDSEDAKQPEIPGETNETVVNPVAPPVEPQGVPEAVVREVAVPNAQEEPTFHDGTDYNRLKAAFERALSHGNFDVDFARTLKKDAGIL